MRCLLASLLLALISIPSFSQKGKAYFLIDSVNYESLSPDDRALMDSLLPYYRHAKNDTARFNVLASLAEDFSDENIWIRYNRLLYQQTKNTVGKNSVEAKMMKRCFAKSLHNFGFYYYTYKSDAKKAFAYYDSCLTLQKEVNDKEIIAATYNNMAIIHQDKGNTPLALDYFIKSLKMEEAMGNKTSIANGLNNIASMYMQQKDTSKAFQYLDSSIALCKKEKFDRGLAFALSNKGALYRDQKNYQEALLYFKNSIPVWEKVGEKSGLSFVFMSIGTVYYKQSREVNTTKIKDSLLTMAVENLHKALKINEEINNKSGLSHTLSNLSGVYFDKNEIEKAVDYGQRGLKIGREIGQPAAIRRASDALFQAYKKQHKFEQALAMHELFIQMRDSIFNEETQKSTFKQQAKYEYEKQKALEDVDHQKELAIAEEGKKRQQIVSYGIGAGLLMVILFALFIFNRLQLTRKQKQIIEHQKLIVDVKNKHITDSINYAKRIQDAILPSKEELSKCFSDYFIFFQPKEIVSGDFYWVSSSENKVVFVIADCTGHGVPGAFMSMIGNTLLNEIVNEKKIYEPASILNKLNEGIIQALHQESRSQDDGMDISVCLIEKNLNRITFAGANHSMYLIKQDVLEEIKGDVFSIGSTFGKHDFLFSQKEIALPPDSKIYLSTDGFSDQLGGERGKKLLSKNLRDLLLSLSSIEINKQEEIIRSEFNKWKGDYSQMDDILLAGVKI